MIIKKRLKFRLVKIVFGLFLVMMGLTGGILGSVINSRPTYAEPVEQNTVTEASTVSPTTVPEESTQTEAMSNKVQGDSCSGSLGAIGWLVCPTTGKIAEAVDWLYDKIESILIINPVPAEDGSPIFEIWKYCRGITNIVFIIFLLVMIYSQITGLGISNYGIKKALPKLIVAAVMVNLSFLICSLAVDLSNVIGNGLRGIFTSIAESAVAGGTSTLTANGDLTLEMKMSYADMYSSMAGGTALAVGAGVIGFETGAIWMLIPTVLGAIVAVVTGLITIALRQAVVALLIMVSPLAMVANILPNTEQWFKKWKDLLYRMLVFYPMFSLLFGASQLAGFAIIASAKDGFGLMLGMAVQIFPLFFSWKLMQMSGTFLGAINARLRGFTAAPLAANRSWAESRRQLSKQRHLASGQAYTPSLRLIQFMSNRRIAREAETEQQAILVKERGMASYALSNYDKRGRISRKGQKAYERQARNMRYQQIIEMDKNNYSRGLAGFNDDYKKTIMGMKRDFNLSAGVYSSNVAGTTLEGKLKSLDSMNVRASDELKMELARGAKIEYDNAKSYHDRITDALNAHNDDEIIKSGVKNRLLHGVLDVNGGGENLERYNRMKNIMEGEVVDTHFIAADAAHTFNANAQIVRGKFKDYFDLTVPTQDVVNRMNELTMSNRQSKDIDLIISGLRTLNSRGDTDLMRQQLTNVLDSGDIKLGTYASQSVASFLMFDVKGSDPFMRRFGKYINLETARMYDDEEEGKEPRRNKKSVSMAEYIEGHYDEEDENGNVVQRDSKRSMRDLLTGTSFKDMERTAIKNMTETIRKYSVNPDTKEFDMDKFIENENKAWEAIMPNIISDQFSFLSGSEQIVALGKGLTGMDSKGNFDWKGIFGKEIAENLTAEQKEKYFDNMTKKRTSKFLEGQVPVQIAKTKSDILNAVLNHYALKNKKGDQGKNFFEKTMKDGKIVSAEDDYNKEDKKAYIEAHMDSIRPDIRNAYSENALKGFAKMQHKGYQGESKEKLIEVLKPEDLYRQYFGDMNNDQRQYNEKEKEYEDDDEDGLMVSSSESETGSETKAYRNEAINAIDNIVKEYLGDKANDVSGAWSEIRNVLEEYNVVSGIVLDDFEKNNVPAFTSVAGIVMEVKEKLL